MFVVLLKKAGGIDIKRKCTWWLILCSEFFYREASDQKFKKKDGETANQLMKAIAVAVSNLVQGFMAHLSISFSMRTVIPADAHAAENVSVEVICSRIMLISVSWDEN